jgi:hypothetical protein
VTQNHKIKKGTELMKKFISAIITIAMLAALLVPMAISVSADAPIEVQSWEEFAQQVNANYGEGNFKLMSDTVCETSVEGFFGTFDGNGHTVTVKTTMFIDIGGGANIKNFSTASDVAIDKTPIILGACGSFEETPINLENITNNVNVDATGNSERVGGIVGWTDGDNYVNFKNCVNNGDLSSNEQIGGIVGNADLANGYFYGNFIDCVNNGNITTSIHYAAGIVGNVNQHCDILMVRCINKGDITAREIAGGLISRILGGKAKVVMYKCANTGDVATTDKPSEKFGVAGLVSRTTGTSTITVYDSYVSGVYAPSNTVDEATGEVLATAGADPICQYASTGTIVLENVKILHNPVVAGSSAYTAVEGASGFEYVDQITLDAGIAAIMADFGKPYEIPEASESEDSDPVESDPTVTEPVVTEPGVNTIDTTRGDNEPVETPAEDVSSNATEKPDESTGKPDATTAAASEGGCASSISLAIVAATAVGAVAISRKKED